MIESHNMNVHLRHDKKAFSRILQHLGIFLFKDKYICKSLNIYKCKTLFVCLIQKQF